MKCLKCGKEMDTDDVDFNFHGNYDEYLYCNNCDVSGFIKVRYNKEIYREQVDLNTNKILLEEHINCGLNGDEFGGEDE